MPDYIVGLDVASKFDYSAFVLLERTPLTVTPAEGEDWAEDAILLRAVYSLQVKRGTRYEQIADHAAALASHPKLAGRIQFAVDVTGVGEAVLEILESRPALADALWAITITPGQKATRKEGLRWSVPKKDLVDSVGVNLQRRRLVCCPHDGRDMETLRHQMFSFKRKLDPKKMTVSFEALSESDKDDLALALCLGCWLSGQLPIEDGGFEASDPYVVLPGANQVAPRFAPSWRGEGSNHRPAGSPLPSGRPSATMTQPPR